MVSATMHRTQILLDDWQYDALKARAKGRGRSLSDLVREIVSAHLDSGEGRVSDRLREVEGVAEGPADLASRHDAYLIGSDDRGRRAARPRAPRGRR